MLDFLKQQLAAVEQELQQLIADRSKVGILAEGEYQVKIDKLKKERKRLLIEIAEEEKNASASTTTPKTEENKQTSNNSPKNFKDELRNLVAAGKLGEALQKANKQYGDDTTILLLGQLNNLNTQKNMGILEYSTYNVRLAQITNGFLSHLNYL